MYTALNTSINCLSNPRLARSIFKDKLKDVDNIKIWYESIITIDDSPFKELNLLCRQTIDEGYRILTSEVLPIPFIFKFKGKFVKPLNTYEMRHIQSSVIKSILLDGDGDFDIRINRAIYVLYNYWFFHKKDIESITHNVCIDIENIISILIDKGFTTYRKYIITNELVEKLREKLMSEKLMNMGDI